MAEPDVVASAPSQGPDVLHVAFSPIYMGIGTVSNLGGICAAREAEGWVLHRVVAHTQYESVAVFVRAGEVYEDSYERGFHFGLKAAARARDLARQAVAAGVAEGRAVNFRPASTDPGWGRPDPGDPEAVFANFWADLVWPNGVWDLEQVKLELFDYHTLLGEVPKVYMHVSGGRISKPTTLARAVIAEHDELWHWGEECGESGHTWADHLYDPGRSHDGSPECAQCGEGSEVHPHPVRPGLTEQATP